MAKYGYTPEVDGQVSEWNEALYKMKRLHELQAEINVVKISPLIAHYVFKKYNFEVWFSLVNALYLEGKADYAKKEIEEVETTIQVLNKSFKSLPVFSRKMGQNYDNKYIREIVNSKNWEMIKNLLEKFETQVKYYNNLHGLSTAKKDDMNRSILR